MPKDFSLRPGLLVALKTAMAGNVTYSKSDVEKEREGSAEVTKWKTARAIADKEEHERAKVIRSNATYTVRRVCAPTAFGYLCPEEREGELRRAIAEARAMVETFNETAKVTRLGFYVITGTIAHDDREATRAVSAELHTLMDAVEAGITSANPKAIREAIAEAKALSDMLSDASKESVTRTLERARKAARAIVAMGKVPAPATEDAAAPAPAPAPAPVADAGMTATEKALAALKRRKAEERAQLNAG